MPVEIYRLLIMISNKATSKQAKSIIHIINTFKSRLIYKAEYSDGIYYDIEAPDGMALQLDKELRAYREVVSVEFPRRQV